MTPKVLLHVLLATLAATLLADTAPDNPAPAVARTFQTPRHGGGEGRMGSGAGHCGCRNWHTLKIGRASPRFHGRVPARPPATIPWRPASAPWRCPDCART